MRVPAPSELVRRWFPTGSPNAEKLCTSCNHVGVPVEEMKGRRDIELTLWAIFAGLAVLYAVNLGILELWNVRFTRATFKLCSIAGKLFLLFSAGYTLFRVGAQH